MDPILSVIANLGVGVASNAIFEFIKLLSGKNLSKEDLSNRLRSAFPDDLSERQIEQIVNAVKNNIPPQQTTNITSYNQSGGITAHSVNVNQAVPPEWSLSPSEKIDNNEWRTKLSAKGVGSMAYHNWNMRLTLNTQVLRREDVPGEVTVGPWMPLKVSGKNLQTDHFFIGFSEFKPGQAFSIYLYTKEPLRLLHVDTLSV